MSDCEHFGGQLAARLYEPLEAGERDALEAHLAQCAECRAAAAELTQLVASIPVRRAVLEEDLLPGVRARVALAAPPRRHAWRWAVPLAAAALVMLALAGIYRAQSPGATVEPGQIARAGVLAPVLEEAEMFMQRGQFNAAYQGLANALEAHPNDPDAGRAQLALAELEYSKFQQYDRAFAAYEALRTQYPDAFGADPENLRRFYLLEEARQHDFEPLYALDRARGSFEQLEEIVGRYPATLAAERAVDSMWRAVGAAQGTGLASLEAVRDRCRNPVAVAQVNMLLADRYWRELNDPKKARELLEQTAGSEHLALSQAARHALSEIDAGASEATAD